VASSSSSTPFGMIVVLFYYAVATHLPRRTRPLGGVSRRIRQLCVKYMTSSPGAWLNVEPRVDIGSGREVRLGEGSGIGMDSRVEALIAEDRVIIGPGCLFLARNHVFENVTAPIGMQGSSEIAPPHIGYGAWIGARVILLPGVQIGAHAVIGAGSVVTHDIPEYAVAVGNPARVVRYWNDRSPEESNRRLEREHRQAEPPG
jgi:maltose O-acetyltransferase